MYHSITLEEDLALKEVISNRFQNTNPDFQPHNWRETLTSSDRNPVPEITVTNGTDEGGVQFIADQLDTQVGTSIESYSYCDIACALEDADRVLAGDPTTRDLIDETNVPTQFRVVPTEGTNVDFLRGLKQSYLGLPGVFNVTLAEEQLDLISRLQGFVSTYTTGLWIALMFASGLLIWNTIRTAMFARRREIEVMKLVGATDWFIRLPFMLEGLLHGLIGGVLASGALWFINDRWTAGVQGFPDNSGMTALVVVDGYQWQVALIILVFGSIVGTVGFAVIIHMAVRAIAAPSAPPNASASWPTPASLRSFRIGTIRRRRRTTWPRSSPTIGMGSTAPQSWWRASMA